MISENSAIAIRQSAITAEPQPLLRLLALARRCWESFPECRLSWGIVVDRALAQVGLQRKWSVDVRAIDDPLEQSDILSRLDALVARATANDTPAIRRSMRAALSELKSGLAQIHARSEQASAEINPGC
jgi:hypothetical protein